MIKKGDKISSKIDGECIVHTVMHGRIYGFKSGENYQATFRIFESEIIEVNGVDFKRIKD